MFESSFGSLVDDDGWLPDVAEVEPPAWLEALPPAEPWTSADALGAAIGAPVGAGQLMNLLQVDAGELSADDAVTFAQQADRFVAYAEGVRARVRADVAARLVEESGVVAAGMPFVHPEMIASAELAAALRVCPRGMDVELALAQDLAGPMAMLRHALLEGQVSAGHVSAIARELNRAPGAGDPALALEFGLLCEQVLAVVVPFAQTHTAGQAARKTRMMVLAADPAGGQRRRREAAERDHGVWLTPTEHGSCELTAVMPLAHGLAVYDAITRLAGNETFQTTEGCLTAGQRKVAALATLILGDPGAVGVVDGPVAEAKITATVNVLVTLATLVDGSGQGGSIGGEPVTGDVILDLLADADARSTLRRLVVDQGGCIVNAGRTRYAISDTQRHLVTLRDGTCRFPGCTRPAAGCEIDHALPWDDGGGTDLANLGALCKHHHQLKTHGGWRITASDCTGRCTWRSPLGRNYQHQPPPLIPAEPEQDPLDVGPMHGPTPF